MELTVQLYYLGVSNSLISLIACNIHLVHLGYFEVKSLVNLSS